LEEMKAVLADWFNDNITSADVPGLLEETCPATEANLEVIVEAAKAEGMTEDTLDQIVAEFQEAMSEIGEDLEN